MIILPKLVRQIWLFRYKVICIALVLIAIPLVLAKFSPTNNIPVSSKKVAYYASELKMRSHKTEFKPAEKPSFKIGIGKPSTSKTSMLDRFLASVGVKTAVFAADPSLPILDVTVHRIVRDGDTVPVVITRSATDEVQIQVADLKSFHPGKYRMSVKSGTRNIEQDFSWGVLAVNTNKSIYNPGETAKIGMGLLDDIGRTKCFNTADKLMQGKMWLTITSPTGEKEELSTENGKITGSSDCDEHSVTNEADFQALYKTNHAGVYQMHLVGENQNGKRSIDDYFEVKDNQDIIVERTSLPTRIYPAADYTNTVTVSSKKGFTGEIKELTPASFHIKDCQGCEIQGKDSLDDAKEPADAKATHSLIWKITLAPNESKTLSYSYNPPNISPEFFILGPISISSGETILYTEARPWQIASDATKTWASTGSTSWNTSANWSPTTVPATTSNVVFDGTSTINCSIDATPGGSSIADLSLNSGYTGTLTENAAIGVTTSGAAGITISAGTFTGSSGLVTVSTAGKLTISGGTFNAGTGGITASTASSTYRLVITSGTFTGAASGTVTLSGGGLQQTGGTFSGGAMTFSLSGTNATNNGYSVTGGTSHTTTTGTVSVVTDVTINTITTWTNSATSFTLATGASGSVSCDRNIGTNFFVTKASTFTLTIGSGCTMDLANIGSYSSTGLFTNNGTVRIATGAGTLARTSGSITNTGLMTNYNVITFTTGVLTNSGTGSYIAGNTITWTSTGTITNSGNVLLNNSTITLTTGAITNTATIDNNGTIATRGNINNTSGTFDNTGGTITILNTAAADAPTFTCGTSSNITAGTFNLNGTGVGSFTVANSGGTCTITATAATGAIYQQITNAGDLTFSGSNTLTIRDNAGTNGNITNTGSITVGSSATVNVERNWDNTGGSIASTGTIGFTSNGTLDNSTFTCPASTTVNGTVNISKTTNSNVVYGSMTISSGCTIPTMVATASMQTYAFTNHGTVTLTSGTLDVRFNATVASGGNITNDGSMTIGSSATVSLTRNFDNTGGTLASTGVITFSSVTTVDNSTFTCPASTTVNGTVNISKVTNSNVVYGSMTISSGCTIPTLVATASMVTHTFTNHGTITLTSGTLSVRFNATAATGGSITNDGSMTINSGTTVDVTRNFDNTGGSLSSAGTITFSSTTTVDNSTFTCPASTTVNGTVNISKVTNSNVVYGSMTISSGCTIPNLVATASMVTYAFSNAGTVTLTSGTLNLRFNATPASGGTFTNTGSFTLSSGAAITATRSFDTGSGTFTNTGTGTVTLNDAAVGDAATLTCGSNNLGDVTINKTLSAASDTTTLGSDCIVDDFTRTRGTISNPGTAKVLTIRGNSSIAGSTASENIGGANLTITLGGSATQTFAYSSTNTFSSVFTVNKSGGSASLTTSFTVTGQTCTITLGTFDIAGQAFTCATGVTVQSGGNFQLQGGETPTTPTLNSGSTVTYTGTNNGAGNTITMKNWSYYHLAIDNNGTVADTFQPAAAVSLSGNLTITAGSNGSPVGGILDVISGTNYAVTVAGNFSNAGTFLAQAGTLTVGTNFTNTGTFTKGTGTVEFNTSSTTVVDGSGSPVITFNNLTVATNDKVVNFTAGKTFRVDGLLTITGTVGHEVVINSTTSSQWFINHQGTENVTYANITNSGCDGTSTAITLDGTTINGGNNGTCWGFVVVNITVSGNIYSDEGSTAYDCSAGSLTVDVAVNGGANSTGTCTLSTGAFSVTATKPTAGGQPVVIFIDNANAGSAKATTITLTADATSNITGVKVYKDHVLLTHESAGPITNANLATGDNADAGIRYSVASSNLTVETGMQLMVYNGKTYTPGGTVTTQGAAGDFHLASSATATLGTATNTISNNITIDTSATLNINTDTIVAGGGITATGTLNTTSGTPTLTMRGTGSISGAGTKTVYNLVVGDGTTATTTLSGALTANNDVTVGTGSTLHQNANLTVSGGDFTTTTTGIVDTTSGTGTVTITGTGNVGAGVLGSFTVYNLAANGTQTLISDITTTNNLSVATGGSLALASQNVTVSGGTMSTAGTGTITCSACSAGTVTISGTGNIGGGGTVTVYTLQINGTQTLASALTVSNTANVATGAILDLGSQNMTVSGGDFTNTTTGIIRCNSCSAGTLTLTATGNLGGGSGDITLYNLATSGTGTTTFSGAGTNTINNNVTVGTGTTLNINSTVGITGSLANTTTGIIGTTTGTPTVSISGSTIGGGSGAITFYNLTKAGAGTTTFSGSGTNTINNNLSVSNGTLTLSNTLTITNDGAVSAGATFNINANLTVNGGDLTTSSTGIINTTSGTPTLTMSGTGNLGGGSGAITFYNLATSGTGTTTFSGSGTNIVNNNVSVGTGTTLNINSSISITGNLTNTTSGNIGTTAGTPTVTVQGTTIGGGTTGSLTFYNLAKSTASTATFSNSGTNTINNNLSITGGTLTQSSPITITSDVNVSTGATFNTNANLDIFGGDMTTTGTGVINTTSGTPLTTISGTGNIGGGGSVTVYALTSSGGTQTIASATTVTTTLTVNGTINGSSNLTVNGDFTGTGTVSMSGGTTEQRVAGAQNFGTSSGSNAWSFATLIFSNSTGASKTITTQTGGSGSITASTLLQVGKGGDSAATVLDAGNRTWTLSGTTGTPFTVPQGSVTASTSTFSYTGNNGAGNTTIRDISYYNLTVNNGSETWNLAASPLNVTSNLTVTAGTLALSTNSLTVGSTSVSNSGGISVSGSLTQSAGGTTTVVTSSVGNATIGGSGTITLYTLTIAPTVGGGTITLGSGASQTITVNNNLNVGDGTNSVTVTAGTNNPILDVNGNMTINTNGTFVAPSSAAFTIAGNMTSNGTFTANSGTVTFDTTTTATLAGSANPAIEFNNITIAISDKTVQFTNGETFKINGLMTVTGTSGHPVTIQSDSSGVQWFVNHQGTEAVTYAAIKDSGCDGSSTSITLDGTNTNNGNNGACWAFTMSITGNIYTDEGSTAYDCSAGSLTVHLSLNGGANYNATCTLNTGAFTFSLIPQVAAGTPMAIFIDSGATPKATTITRTPTITNSISGLKLYQNHLNVSHEDSGPITNTDLANADNGDAGIRYAVGSGNLTVDSGITLYVYNGKTYNPGGTVTTNTTGGDFKLGTSAVATLGNATTIGADITVGTSATLNINADTTVGGGDITTTGTLTTTSGTPTVTMRGTGTVGGAGSSTFYNFAIGDGTTATSTLGSDITVSNDLSVATGSSLALASKNVTVSGGDMSTAGTGTITCSGCSAGTVTISGTGNIGGGGTVTVYNLTSSSGTQTISSATTVTNTLTTNGTLTGSSTLTVNGAMAGTGTMNMTGTTEQRVGANQNFGTTSGSNDWSFATLIFSNSTGTSKTITTQTGGSGALIASTLLQIGKGGDSAATVLDAGNRTWTLSATTGTPFTLPQGSITVNTSTFNYTGNYASGNTTIANTSYYNLTVNNSSETWNAAASPLTVTNTLTVTAGTLDLQTNSATIGSSSVTNSGNIAVSGTLTQSASGTTTVVTSTSGTNTIGGSGSLTFYNLSISPTVSGSTTTLGSGASQTLAVSNTLTIGDGSHTVTATANTNNPTIDINGAFTINASGTFVAPPAAAFTIAGNMTNNGTFTANNGTVTFDGAGTSTIAGSGSPAITFYNLKSTTLGKTLAFTAGETFRTNGLLTFADVNINSTTSSQWFINHQGTESVLGTTITNSGCDGASTDITLAATAVNGGNNGACWLFAGSLVPSRVNGTVRVGGNTRFQ